MYIYWDSINKIITETRHIVIQVWLPLTLEDEIHKATSGPLHSLAPVHSDPISSGVVRS